MRSEVQPLLTVCQMVYILVVTTKSQEGQSRIDFRVPAAVKTKFQEAALYDNGGDLSAFVISAGLERANRVLAAHETLVINDVETRERFYAAIRDTSPPSQALRHLMARDDLRFRMVD